MTFNPKTDWLLSKPARDVQIEALRQSYPKRGWGHFLDMRLGKTTTALNEFLLFHRDFDVRRLLVVSPAKYKGGWRSEAEEFGVQVPIHVFEASPGKQSAAHEFVGKDEGIFIINPETLLSGGMELVQKFVAGGPFMLVVDESAMFKNPQAKAFRKLLPIAKAAAFVRILSGKPNPNGAHEFWSQLRLCGFLEGFNFFAFKYTFCKMGGFKGKQIIGLRNPERLNETLSDMCFRAKREDWGLERDVDYEIVPVDMQPAQSMAYKSMQNDFLVWLSEEKVVSVDIAIAKHAKLQQISSGFLIDEKGDPQPLVQFEKTPKFNDLLDRLENYINGKTIVLAHYSHTIDCLLSALEGLSPAVIRGGMSVEATEAEKWSFNEDPNCRVLVAQAQAAKYGHRLMGSADDPCLSMCFFENTYSLDARSQCEERPQGAGQQGTLHIWDYASSKIERDIIKALQRKEALSDVIMSYRS